MGTEVKPFGVKCNIQCQYCYQNPIRDAGNVPLKYDLVKIKEAIEKEGEPFTLFGGEPLLMPKKDLEELWAWGLGRFGRNSLQTNGTLIDQDHIALFKRYRVHVGLSLDGPGELNDPRWNGTLAKTRQSTESAHAAIERLCNDGLRPSLIITLHRANASEARLPALCEWIRRLDKRKIRQVRLHLLEHESHEILSRYGLSADENVHALLTLAALEKTLKRLRFDVFEDMRNLLLGQDHRATCVWTACDPYTTQSVHGIEGNGERSNCGRTNKEGIESIKSDTAGFERYLALYHTPQESGGCKDCRFFLMCKGQCPGTAIDGDWRNRTGYCEVWKRVYAAFEQEMIESGIEPLSVSSRRGYIERRFIEAWSKGLNPSMFYIDQSGVKETTDQSQLLQNAPISTRDRLDFRLPKFTRVSWVSSRAQSLWGPRCRRIRAAWKEIEAYSVLEKLRDSAVIAAPRNAWDVANWRSAGLKVEVIESQAGSNGPPRMHAIIARDGDTIARMIAAWDARLDVEIGGMLGYPDCCCGFYHQARRIEQHLDLTWLAASAAPPNAAVRAPREVNIFWMPLGIRAIPHTPCGPDCVGSEALGRRLLELGERLGFNEEMTWLRQMLAWPVQWSALHGIAETKTPILKFMTRTDATASKYSVKWLGETDTEDRTKGLSFPYEMPAAPYLTGSPGYKRGMENPALTNISGVG
jgi:uncharacterized protein